MPNRPPSAWANSDCWIWPAPDGASRPHGSSQMSMRSPTCETAFSITRAPTRNSARPATTYEKRAVAMYSRAKKAPKNISELPRSRM